MADGQQSPNAYGELGVSGLDIFSGYVRRDPEISLQGTKAVEQYDLMRLEDPTVAAVLAGLSLPIRRAVWQVEPASDSAADVEAAEFAWDCLNDMSHTWDDFLSDVCTMFPFGWSWFEWVLKKRRGYQAPGAALPSSRFDDGRIGLRKIALRSQVSLDHWEYDDNGGIQGLWQSALTRPRPVFLPISKALLFRTTREMNNPEGQSVLRAAWRDWTYKRNMERIEGIGLQRAMAGFPVVKLLDGATTKIQAGTNSDEAHAENIITGVHSNKSLGVIEHGKLEFRFESPDMKGITGDSDTVIRRKDEGIARASLAMFILLGSKDAGSWARSRELGDMFFLAVEAYLGSIADTFNRFAMPVLFRYNAWPGLTDYPQLTAAVNRRVDLEQLSTVVNSLVGARVLTPDDELERHVRELAELPEADPGTARKEPVPVVVAPPGQGGQPGEGEGADAETGEQEGEGEPEGQSRRHPQGRGHTGQRRPESFARGAARGRAYTQATDAYQASLQSQYDAWAAETARELAKVDPDDEDAFRRKLDDRLAVGLLLLKKLGWFNIPAAFILGFGEPAGPDERRMVDDEIAANDGYLETELFADIRGTLEGKIDAVLLLLRYGDTGEAVDTITGLLSSFRARVGRYAGQFWHAIQSGIVGRLKKPEAPGAPADPQAGKRVRWVLDAGARHCVDCLEFAGEYNNIYALLAATRHILPGQGTKCSGNCRCHLEVEVSSGVWEWL